MQNELGLFVHDEVVRAEADLKALRDRATSILNVTSGMVALVAGVLAIARGGSTSGLPTGAAWPLGLAFLAFTVATIVALKIHQAVVVDQADPAKLKTFVNDNWSDPGWDQKVAKVSATYLVSLRASTEKLAGWLTWVVGLEVGGVLSIGAAALVFLVAD